ncbi:MAG: Gfo/Idh/MocA family oxidoreductase, partial [Planctomycetota bacterium]
MSDHVSKTISRRRFVGAAASTAFAFNVVPAKVLAKDAPSNKLGLAIIGAGGQGGYSLKNTTSENLVAIADVDKVRSANAVRKNPNAKFFNDFRAMLDKMDKDIDAVMVCTPDHNH